MKWRHWAILIALVLVNYIIFSCAFTQLAKQRNAAKHALRTPMPTFESVEQNPIAWIVLPTSTQLPSRTPVTATATEIIVVAVEVTPTVAIVETETPVPATPLPTATPTPATVQHEVQAGETLGGIAKVYNVTVEVIVVANSLSDPDQIGRRPVADHPGYRPSAADAHGGADCRPTHQHTQAQATHTKTDTKAADAPPPPRFPSATSSRARSSGTRWWRPTAPALESRTTASSGMQAAIR